MGSITSLELTTEGEHRFANGDLEGARTCFELALKITPDDPAAANNLGVVLWQQGKPGEALLELSRMLMVNRDYRPAVVNAAEILQAINQVGRAQELLHAYLEEHPEDLEVERMLRVLDGESREQSGAAPRVPPNEPVTTYERYDGGGDPRREQERRRQIEGLERKTGACANSTPTGAEQGAAQVPVEEERREQLYREWRRQHSLKARDIALYEERVHEKWSAYPSVQIVMMDVHDNPLPVVDSAASVAAQLYPGWGMSVISGRPSLSPEFESEPNLEWIVADKPADALQSVIEESTADWMMFLISGDQLEPHCLVSMLDLVDAGEGIEVVYPDADTVNDAGEYCDARFKPGADADSLRSSDYIGNACLLRTEMIKSHIQSVSLAHYGFIYGILLKVLETGGEQVFAHDDNVLFHQYEANVPLDLLPSSMGKRKEYLERHLASCGLKARVSEGYTPGVFHVEYQHACAPLVSVIVPTKDGMEVLEPCISTLIEKTAYKNFEVIVVDNNSCKPETLEYFDRIQAQDARIRVVKYPHAYNYSSINNMAAGLARGDYLVLLNNDTAIIKEDWLDRMLSIGQREDVGIVGARLLHPDTTIQHAGVVVGMTSAADHSHIGCAVDSPGYMGQILTVRGVCAVTAACLLIRKDVFFSVGGLDEKTFAVLFNDVDLCLKVREKGLRVVYTPYAVLMHHGSFSLKKAPEKTEKKERGQRECLAMNRKWMPVMANDPAYNRNLSLGNRDVLPEVTVVPDWDMHRHDRLRLYMFRTGAWLDDRSSARTVLSVLQENDRLRYACIPPHGQADAWVPQPVEIARGQPDVLLVPEPASELHATALEYYAEFNKGLFIVLVLENRDCVPVRGRKKRASHLGENEQRVRRALASCDRLLVTSRELADAWAGVIADIKMVPPVNSTGQEGLDQWLEALTPPALSRVHTDPGKPDGTLNRQRLARYQSWDSEHRGAEEALIGAAATDGGSHAPRAAYRKWTEIHALQQRDIRRFSRRMMSGWTHNPSIHLVTTHVAGQEAALADTLDALGSQLYGGWGLSVVSNAPCPDPMFEEMDMLEWQQVERELIDGVNEVVQLSSADWLCLLEVGNTLEPHMLYQHVEHVHQHPEWRLVYMDEDRIDGSGERCDPLFKPDFNLELLRATPYLGKCVLIERQALLAAGGYGQYTGAEAYDAVLRVVEQCGEHAVGHIPDVLVHSQDRFQLAVDQDLVAANRRAIVAAHLERCGIEGEAREGSVFGSCFVDYACGEKPPVEIIVPVGGRPETLELFLDSLVSRTDYPNYRVRLLINESVDVPDTLRQRDNIAFSSYPQSSGQWQAVLALACSADSDLVMLMSPGAIAIQPNWLERLVAHFQKGDVAVVAPRLLLSDKTVAGGGIVTGAGPHSVGMAAFGGLALDDSGYMGRAQVAQELSAVSASCMLVRTSAFESAGAEAGSFRLAFYQAVDFCLRVRESGGKIVWTPHSTLMFVGEDQSELDAFDLDELVVRESQALCAKSLHRLANDPAYNPNLTLTGKRFSVDDSFTPPWMPADRGLKRIIGFGAGSLGSWKYRVEQPLNVVHRDQAANTLVLPFDKGLVPWPDSAELERLQPSALLMHNTMHDVYMDRMETYRKVNGTFMVYGQDDLMFALPPKNPYSKTVYKDAKKRLRRCLRIADRVIVTTEALAEELRCMTDDIRVVPNFLDDAVWGRLTSRRGTSRKPRVGWAGAQQHLGDLELLEEVVRATADEVDWVFLGMCPEFLHPYVRERHDAVAFEEYPEKLASLDLDLAVAPLEHNRFNNAKSNLRILEYGALGWPVVASDIAPYRDGPLCRVANQPRAWIGAIRERIHDLDATRREGDALRAWVRENWLLQQHLGDWLAALDPAGDTAMHRKSGQAASL